MSHKSQEAEGGTRGLEGDWEWDWDWDQRDCIGRNEQEVIEQGVVVSWRY